MTDIRYIQCFENFEKSFFLLKSAIGIDAPSIVEIGGVMQFFETTFELAWKLMKDYMAFQGYDVNSPRQSAWKRSPVQTSGSIPRGWGKSSHEPYASIRNQWFRKTQILDDATSTSCHFAFRWVDCCQWSFQSEPFSVIKIEPHRFILSVAFRL